MIGTVTKDSRWFAWYDACVGWDAVWHVECMVHAFAWWLDGVSPWDLTSQDSAAGGNSESYSSRVVAWNVAWLS